MTVSRTGNRPDDSRPARMTPAAWALLILALVFAVQAVYFYPLLPPKIASHFGVGGIANGWMSKDGFFLTMILLPAGISLLFFAIPKAIAGFPAEVINIPHREYWLTEERRPQAMRILRNNLLWIAALVFVLFNGILRLTCAANLREPPVLDETWVFILMGGFFAGLIASVVQLFVAFRVPRG